MPEIINLYCDESCHLENNGLPITGFGALRYPADHLTTVTQVTEYDVALLPRLLANPNLEGVRNHLPTTEKLLCKGDYEQESLGLLELTTWPFYRAAAV